MSVSGTKVQASQTVDSLLTNASVIATVTDTNVVWVKNVRTFSLLPGQKPPNLPKQHKLLS